jgi:hypothetical protein
MCTGHLDGEGTLKLVPWRGGLDHGESAIDRRFRNLAKGRMRRASGLMIRQQ